MCWCSIHYCFFLFSRECWVSPFILEIVHGFLSITQIFSFLVPMSIKVLFSCSDYPKKKKSWNTKMHPFSFFISGSFGIIFHIGNRKGFSCFKECLNISFAEEVLDNFSWKNKIRPLYIWDSQNGVVEDSSLQGFGPVSFREWFPSFEGFF